MAKREQDNQAATALRDKINRKTGESLNRGDILTLASNILTAKTLKTTFWKGLCLVKFFCRKRKPIRLQNRVTDRVENSLDIRKILATQTNIRLLLNILFSKK